MSEYVSKKAVLEHIRREIGITERQQDAVMTRHMKEFHGGAIRALQNLEHAIQSGAFDVPEMEHINAYWAREGLIKHQQEEIQRLRAAAIKLHETINSFWQGDCDKTTVVEAQSNLCDILSTTTEPIGVELVRKYCPDNVQRLFEEHYNNIFATGERNYHECDICEAIEKTAKYLGYNIDYARVTELEKRTEPTAAERVREIWRFYISHEDYSITNAIEEVLNALGITIPGINAPEGDGNNAN